MNHSIRMSICAFALLAIPFAAHGSGEAGNDMGTLDAITIEGEIPLPQVLFISSREQPFYEDELHRLFLQSFTDASRETLFPVRIRLAPPGLSIREGI